MDRLREAEKAEDLAGYVTALTTRGTAPREDREEAPKDTHLRLLSSMAMAKVVFEP